VTEYWLLKTQAMAAKCLNKIKDLAKAEDMCNDILAFVKEHQGSEEVKKYSKFAVKVLYIKAKNMLNMMEFRKAKSILEDEVLPILKAFSDNLEAKPAIVEEGDGQPVYDDTKELQDNRYSFLYRKKYALYLKKFAFYDRAEEVLKKILAEEIAYYGL
jgi:hypothetical protein